MVAALRSAQAFTQAGVAEVDFGEDLSCVLDLEDDMAEVSGLVVLEQAIARRLSTPRGLLWQDPHYGLDLRSYLSRSLTQAEVAAVPRDVAKELEKDERVQSASVRVLSQTLRELRLAITVTTAAGPFSLTISATDAAVTLASVAAGGA